MLDGLQVVYDWAPPQVYYSSHTPQHHNTPFLTQHPDLTYYVAHRMYRTIRQLGI